jgi:hypothetical protein
LQFYLIHTRALGSHAWVLSFSKNAVLVLNRKNSNEILIDGNDNTINKSNYGTWEYFELLNKYELN